MLVERPRIRLDGPCLIRHRSQKRALYRAALYAAVSLVLSISGCATLTFTDDQAETGIRVGFEATSLGKIAIIPFATSDFFGLSDAEREAAVRVYEDSAAARLEAMGFSVITCDEVRAALAAAQGEPLLERLDIDRPLPELFEVTSTERGALEDDRIRLAKELAALVGADTLLIGQVIYHTEALCDIEEQSKYSAHIAFVPGEAIEGERQTPCAISHFEAKMLRGSTGQAIWYNRALRELRAASTQAPRPDPLDNARSTVDLVFSDQDSGLRDFLAAR